MQHYEYAWEKTKPRIRTVGSLDHPLHSWDEHGWEPIAVTTRPGILGGIFGTTATWTLLRRPRVLPDKPPA